MTLRSPAPEAGASTNSAIWACLARPCLLCQRRAIGVRIKGEGLLCQCEYYQLISFAGPELAKLHLATFHRDQIELSGDKIG